MPQRFQVLRCFDCHIFQVHQVKKAKKWDCKMCGAKQSIKQVFALGSGKECRLHVQKINLLVGECNAREQSEKEFQNVEEIEHHPLLEQAEFHHSEFSQPSKWSQFLVDEQEDDQPHDSAADEDFYPLDEQEALTETVGKTSHHRCKSKRVRPKAECNRSKNRVAGTSSMGRAAYDAVSTEHENYDVRDVQKKRLKGQSQLKRKTTASSRWSRFCALEENNHVPDEDADQNNEQSRDFVNYTESFISASVGQSRRSDFSLMKGTSELKYDDLEGSRSLLKDQFKPALHSKDESWNLIRQPANATNSGNGVFSTWHKPSNQTNASVTTNSLLDSSRRAISDSPILNSPSDGLTVLTVPSNTSVFSNSDREGNFNVDCFDLECNNTNVPSEISNQDEQTAESTCTRNVSNENQPNSIFTLSDNEDDEIFNL